MAQQILIIGLGHFGMSLARTLTLKGAEVLASDIRPHLVEEASEFVTEALVLDAAEEDQLARLSPGNRDAAVCAIGDESREASIICTALLRQMGCPHIIARGNERMHRRILQLVGAHQIINPEEEFGRRFATRLLYRNVIVDTVSGDELQMSEVNIRENMIGRTLIELELPKRFGIMVAGIRRGNMNTLIQPRPDEPLKAGDVLVIVSSEAAIEALAKGE